jgi:hypothetical protein
MAMLFSFAPVVFSHLEHTEPGRLTTATQSAPASQRHLAKLDLFQLF